MFNFNHQKQQELALQEKQAIQNKLQADYEAKIENFILNHLKVKFEDLRFCYISPSGVYSWGYTREAQERQRKPETLTLGGQSFKNIWDFQDHISKLRPVVDVDDQGNRTLRTNSSMIKIIQPKLPTKGADGKFARATIIEIKPHNPTQPQSRTIIVDVVNKF
jgi:hypothetical protein